MGYTIPVFFLPVSQSHVAERLASWQDAIPYLPDSEWWRTPAQHGVRVSRSRNWWHQHTLAQICKALRIEELAFVLQEVVCLPPCTLPGIANALDTVIKVVANGVPDMGNYECPDITFLRLPFNDEAFNEAVPTYNGRNDDSAESFYSFLKSLHQAVYEAIRQGSALLYIQPQP